MFLARPFAAATTWLLIGGAFFVVLSSASDSQVKGQVKARVRWSKTGESTRTAGAARRTCRTARRSSKRPARGTPSRDLRLLIAMDVVRGFPDRVARRPERYAMPNGKSVADVKAELESVLASELLTRQFCYTRSDGSEWTLALKDVLDRSADLEMAYNPNDCVELRWGAPDKSEEASTCKRHASTAQSAKMQQYRAWFHERRRPPT